MTANVHPSSSELLTALREPDQATSMLEHLDGCLACRVRMSRIRHATGLGPASANSLQRIVEASTPLPEILASLVSSGQGEEPEPNDIWRVGRDEALLVWVRSVFADGVADVIPLVLDVELADQDSLVVGADATPLATETAAMVSLRTHVHIGAFLNKVGTLDIRTGVTEVMTAVREGRRPSGVRVGPSIDDDDDQRLEYRQALRDLLAELSPSAWLAAEDEPGTSAGQTASETGANHPQDGIDTIKTDLGERLRGAQCRDLELQTFAIDGTVRVTTVLKVLYLNTAVVVATLDGATPTFPETRAVAAACRKITLIETDADAVAVAIPRGDWQALLFTTAHTRDAFELPGGSRAGPTPTLCGYGLVDTLCKHLEGTINTWETTEPARKLVRRTDLHQIAAKHASTSIGQITVEGNRAHQPAKKAAWGSLPDEFDQRVAKFITSVINSEAVDDALAELTLETRDD